MIVVGIFLRLDVPDVLQFHLHLLAHCPQHYAQTQESIAYSIAEDLDPDDILAKIVAITRKELDLKDPQ